MKIKNLIQYTYIPAALICFLLLIGQACNTKSISPESQAEAIIDASGVKGGLIVHLNCGDGTLTNALKVNASYLVQGLDASKGNVDKSRKYIMSKGNYGPVSADRITGNQLPYIDNFVNLIVADDPGKISKEEIMRVLIPEGVLVTKKGSQWVAEVKPMIKGLDEWNQFTYNSEGNMVSKDELVSPVEHYQWIGSPKWGRHHDTLASLTAMVSANGRIFYIIDEGPTESIELPSEVYLVARDAYNGTILWKKPIAEWFDHMFGLKSGPAYLPRRLVAQGDRVFVTLGINAPLSELDAVTGEVIRTFEGTDETSEIILSDNKLYLNVGRPERKKVMTFGEDDTWVWKNADRSRMEFGWNEKPSKLMAINLADGKTEWIKNQYPVSPVSLQVDSGSVYFHDGDNLIALDRKDGSEKWKTPVKRKKGNNQITLRDSPLRDVPDTAFAPRMVIYDDMVLYSGGLRQVTALSAKDGKQLWAAQIPASTGHWSLEDLFIIKGKMRFVDTAMGNRGGNIYVWDVKTGELEETFKPDFPQSLYWFHQRCYPNKATENYLIPSRTGLEFIDPDTGHWDINHWARGGCAYGVMPSNGLIFTPPTACACYMEAKISGLSALGGKFQSTPDLKAALQIERLEKGPAYSVKIEGNEDKEDWPTYRHDEGRTAYTKAEVPSEVNQKWNVKLSGKLSSPVAAGNKVYVAQVDTHTVYAMDSASGKELWKFTAGARVDSPPTIYKGRVLFGSADGYVYCLNSADGALAWRFRAAPMDRRMMNFEQVESVWPVHGNVLVKNDKLYCVAGRNMFLDEGMRFLILDPVTGEKLDEKIMNDKDPETGEDMHKYVNNLDMATALPDILSSDGKYIYMRSQQFDLDGNRKNIGVKQPTDQKGEGQHVFSPVGFLDDSQFFRTFLMYGKSVKGGWGGWESMAKYAPAGRLIAVGDDAVYGFGRKPEFLAEGLVIEFQLFSAEKGYDDKKIQGVEKPDGPSGDGRGFMFTMMGYSGDWKVRQGLPKAQQTAVDYKWLDDEPEIQVMGLVVANDNMYVAGPPDVVDEEDAFFSIDDKETLKMLKEQSELLKGKEGGYLWTVSAKDGKKLSSIKIDSLPTWDGLIAADGKLFMTTMKGELICYAN